MSRQNFARFNLIFCFCLLGVLSGTSCKSREDRKDESGSSVKGVISQSPPGGTLMGRSFANYDCSKFKEAVWYRMSRPVGAMIWHQYIGLRLTESSAVQSEGQIPERNEFQTSGLSNSSDLENLTSWWNEKGESNRFAHMISSKKYAVCSDFLAAVKRINQSMASSSYQNVGIRVLAMVVAPVPVLGGRPCAKQAQTATETWLTSGGQGATGDFCDDCTEVIPGARWSEDSVDWDESAFRKAETSDRK